MKKLLLLFLIIVPAMEIGVLILSSNAIGLPATLLLIVLTGVLGVVLAKKEGLNALRTAQMQLAQRQVPGSVLLDGICILAGGIALIIPGFITDIFGLLLLIPQTRAIFKGFLQRTLQKAIKTGSFVYIANNRWNRRP